MTIRMLDPTYDGAGAPFALAPRLGALKGLTVGVVSNGKKGTYPFFDSLEKQLVEDLGVKSVVHRVKGNYSATVPEAILAEAKSWDFAFTGIGD